MALTLRIKLEPYSVVTCKTKAEFKPTKHGVYSICSAPSPLTGKRMSQSAYMETNLRGKTIFVTHYEKRRRRKGTATTPAVPSHWIITTYRIPEVVASMYNIKQHDRHFTISM